MLYIVGSSNILTILTIRVFVASVRYFAVIRAITNNPVRTQSQKYQPKVRYIIWIKHGDIVIISATSSRLFM